MTFDMWEPIPFDSSVKAVQTFGRPSSSRYGQFNLGLNVGDNSSKVMMNRDRLATLFGAPVHFPHQVHGSVVDELIFIDQVPKEADAVVTSIKGLPVGVLTADCLPVIFSNGKQVAAAHAGWRGLANGVLENVINAFDPSYEVSAWLGPCIGFESFEVGPEVVDQFLEKYPSSESSIAMKSNSDRAFIDIQQIAINVLESRGIGIIGRRQSCTVLGLEDWYSYRRQSVTGRMATCIMLLE